MRSVLEKVWLKLIIVVLMLSVLAIGLVTRCCNMRVKLPEGACYVITVEEKGKSETLTLAYDADGNLLLYQKGSEKVSYTYDDQGRMLTRYGHDTGLNVPLRMVDYIYDEAGNLIREEGYYMNEKDSFYTTYDYDEVGNLINRKEYQRGKLLQEWIYSSNGKLLAQIHHQYEYRYDYSYDYSYRNGGKLVEILYTSYHKDPGSDNQGVTTRKTIYEYKVGKLVKKSCVPWDETTYAYDSHRRLIKRIRNDGLQIITEFFTYDENDNLLTYVYENTNRRGENISAHGCYWEYDEQGRMIRYGSLDADGNPTSTYYVWSYDAAGNVVRIQRNSKNPLDREFIYTWPEGELPQAVKESAAAYIAELTMLTGSYLPEYYLKD